MSLNDWKLTERGASKVEKRVTSSPAQARRHGREIRLLRSLSHPNVTPLYDCFTDGDAAYLVTRLADGDLHLVLYGRERPPAWNPNRIRIRFNVSVPERMLGAVSPGVGELRRRAEDRPVPRNRGKRDF